MTAGIEERPLTATDETGPKLSIGRRLRSGFSRFGPLSFTYGTVTVRPLSEPLNSVPKVTWNPLR